MDGYLARRLSNPVYGGTAPNRRTETEWYASCADASSRSSAHPLQKVRHEASARNVEPALKRVRHNAADEGDDKMKKKKKKKKEKEKTNKKEGDHGHWSSSSGSGSDSDNPCWKGYKRKPGTKKYAEGSCVKA